MAEFQATAAGELEGKAARAGAIATDMSLELQTHVSPVQKPPVKAIVLGVSAMIALVALLLFRASERPAPVVTAATAVEAATASALAAPVAAEVPRPSEPPPMVSQPPSASAGTPPAGVAPVGAASTRAGKSTARSAEVRTTPAPAPSAQAKTSSERGVIRANPFGALE